MRPPVWVESLRGVRCQPVAIVSDSLRIIAGRRGRTLPRTGPQGDDFGGTQPPDSHFAAQGVSQYMAPFRSAMVSATNTAPAVPRERDSSRTPRDNPRRSCRTRTDPSAPRSTRPGPLQCTAARGPSPTLSPPKCIVGRTPNVLETPLADGRAPT